MTVRACYCRACQETLATVIVALAARKVTSVIAVAPPLAADPNSFHFTVARSPEVTA